MYKVPLPPSNKNRVVQVQVVANVEQHRKKGVFSMPGKISEEPV